jgi:hypothetical protein
MSTKPTVHAEWDTNNTNVSATTGGHKSDGWANDEIPTAGEMNHWMNQVSAWTEWLYDGDMAINDLLVGGTLGVTGVSTLNGVLNANAAANFASTVEIDGTVHIVSTTTMDDDLNVDGDVTITGDFKHGTRTFVQGFENIGYSSGATRSYVGGVHYVTLAAAGTMSLGLVAPMLTGKHRLTAYRIAMSVNSLPTLTLTHQAFSPQPVVTTLALTDWTATSISNNGTDMVYEYVLDTPLGLAADDLSARLVLNVTSVAATDMKFYSVALLWESVP